MSLLNYRNAIMGWAAWKVVKRIVREKVLRKAPFIPSPPPAPTVVQRARSPRAFAAYLAAAGSVFAFLRLRKGGGAA
jgi:hypothetical protein